MVVVEVVEKVEKVVGKVVEEKVVVVATVVVEKVVVEGYNTCFVQHKRQDSTSVHHSIVHLNTAYND